MGSTREGTGAYRVLVGKPEVKRSLGRYRHRWVFNREYGLWTGLIKLSVGTNNRPL